jgi:hypothetical protein
MKNFITPALITLLFSCTDNKSTTGENKSKDSTSKDSILIKAPAPGSRLDTARYNRLLAHISKGDTTGRWPVKTGYPLPGAILPFNRLIAYYGNLYSNRMGALGKWPKQEMIKKLLDEVKEWNAADSVIKSIPALHYICITAQSAPGRDGKYRFRMPFSQIDTVLKWAKEINAIVFLDIQVGLSTLQDEVPLLEKYLSMPNVHFGIDPEFILASKGKRPGSAVGTVDATDINWVGDYLADLVRKHDLPPKIFMIHRFTQGMVTNTQNIKLHPEIQIVMDMDGWGSPAKKKSTWYNWIYPEPVQFTGFKLFYVNDTKKSGEKEMMSKTEILKLVPVPVYIQYQ